VGRVAEGRREEVVADREGLLSFIAGTAFGMAAWAVVTGFQGLDSNGWLDNFAGTTLVSAADKVAPSGGA